jgi:hypothetical protein
MQHCKHEYGHAGIDLHDCAYVQAIDELIPSAETIANTKVPVHIRSTRQGSWEWDRAFAAAMDELCRVHGIRRR